MTHQQGVEIEFARLHPVAVGEPPRQDLKPFGFLFRVDAPVRFDQPADDVYAALLQLMGAVEHRVGLPAPGCRAEVDREPSVSDAHPVCGGLRDPREGQFPVSDRALHRIDDEQVALERTADEFLGERAERNGDQRRLHIRQLRLGGVESGQRYDRSVELRDEFSELVDVALADERDVERQVERLGDARTLFEERAEVAVAGRQREQRRGLARRHLRNCELVDRVEHDLAQRAQRRRPENPALGARDVLAAHDGAVLQARFELLERNVECDHLVRLA